MANISREMKDLVKQLESPDRPPAEVVLPRIRAGLSAGGRARKPAAQALQAIAADLVGPEIEDELLELLEDDKEAYQRIGLEIVARLRRPPRGLVETVADASYLPEARRALLRFDRERVKRELRSLLNSRNANERLTGLQIVQQYGPSAAEFSQQIAEGLASDRNARSAIAAINALTRLLPEDELALALEPTLDHFDANVRKLAQSHLKKIGAPVRDSAWNGHPFAPSLRQRLQVMGFVPKGSDMLVPEDRPANIDRPFEYAEEGQKLEPFQLSPATWAFLNMLEFPPYTLYQVWGSYEDSQTFHFSSEDPIYLVDGHYMHVIGDGSIGYFACIDLKDPSNDPAVYHIERWYNEGWKVTWSLSSYLRDLGLRG